MAAIGWMAYSPGNNRNLGDPRQPFSSKKAAKKHGPGSVPDTLAQSYDIVTLVHHNDMQVLMEYGLESWGRFFFTDGQARVFAVCTPEALVRLQAEQARKRKKSAVWDKLVLVNQAIYPFNLTDMGVYGHERDAWVYQQILKLYAYPVLSQLHPRPLQRFFLVMDSDTVAIRPYSFLVEPGRPLLNFAAEQTGAFGNDARIARGMWSALFQLYGQVPHNRTLREWPKRALPERQDFAFTLIAHCMLWDGWIIQEMLSWWQDFLGGTIPPYTSLSSTPYLSEWEFYGTYVMRYYRNRMAYRMIPYLNWGQVDAENLAWMRHHTDLVYVTKHDNWQRDNICCVNTRSFTAKNTSSPSLSTIYHPKYYKNEHFECRGCPVNNIDRELRLDCAKLKMLHCRDAPNDTVWFDDGTTLTGGWD